VATYTFNVKITTNKDLRKNIVEMMVVDALNEMNVSVEASGTEKPVSVEIKQK
jgi:hypothetical protein